MSAPTYTKWIQGDPATVDAVRSWLDAGKRTTREAVATQQKRWGQSPTGALSMSQFARLLAENSADEPPAETTTAAAADPATQEDAPTTDEAPPETPRKGKR